MNKIIQVALDFCSVCNTVRGSGEKYLKATNYSIELYTKLITISQVIPLVSLKGWISD